MSGRIYIYDVFKQKDDKKKRSLAYGPIIEILNDTASKSLNNTYNDLFFLLCKKSNYSKEIVKDVIENLECLRFS